ncbi:MAG: glycosyltransferase [Sphaerochaetaceae bacterium]|nr:glycosyltransferase [Sphaerochaetaceae bacterium]
MKDLISVIVPIYKVEKYLSKCIDSILNQTYANLEIILVDDGSPDNCGKICDDYAVQDNRIKVIHQKNGGVSKARNNGVKASTGSFISFVDSDDWIENDYIESLYLKINKDDVDLAICGYKSINAKQNNNIKIAHRQDARFSNIQVLKADSKNTTYGHIATWAKMYRRRLFDYVAFPDGKICEDLFTYYKFIYYSREIEIINKPLYNYMAFRDGSIMTVKYNLSMLDEIEAQYGQILFYQSKEELTDCISGVIPRFFYNYAKGMHCFKPQTKNEKIRVEEIRDMAKTILIEHSKNIGFLERLAFYTPNLYMFLKSVFPKEDSKILYPVVRKIFRHNK